MNQDVSQMNQEANHLNQTNQEIGSGEIETGDHIAITHLNEDVKSEPYSRSFPPDKSVKRVKNV